MTVDQDRDNVISLLNAEYPEVRWENSNLETEQLYAILRKEEKKEMKNNMISEFGDQIFSQSNSILKTSGKEDFLENWLLNIYEELQKDNPDWNFLKINLGDTEEDEEQLEIMKRMFEDDKEKLIKLYIEELEEDLVHLAQNFVNETPSGTFIDKERIIQEISGGEDLTRTKYGPIDSSAKLESNFDSEIVNKAISQANEFAPVVGKEILVMDTGDSGPYGVVETDLQGKIIRNKYIDQLKSLPDKISNEDYIKIMRNLEEDLKKGVFAFRVNPVKIAETVEQLMSEIKKGAESYGLGHLIPIMYNEVLTLAIGSVIAHEAEHTVKMTSLEGDPDDEARAVSTENRFLDEMLSKEEYKIIRPFITRKNKIISQEDRDNMVKNLIEEYGNRQNNIKSWYKIT